MLPLTASTVAITPSRRNRSAIALYRSCGFQPEGVLRAEFYLEGQYVDDVLMARQLVALPVATQAVSESSP